MSNRPLRSTARWLVILVLYSLGASRLVAYPVLTFTVTSHKEPAAGATASGKPVQPSDKTFPLLVTLGHQYLIVEAEGNLEFFWGKQKLMSVSDKTQALPTAYQSEYWRFLRYYAGGHPKVYGALTSVNGVPKKISFVLTNMGTETREIALNAIHNAADTPYSREGLELAARDQEPYNTLKLLGPDAAAKLTERMDAAVKARDAAMAQGEVLDAMLTNMSILIMSGDGAGPAAWLAQHRDAILSNELAHSLSGNLEPRDQAGAQKSLQILSELHKQPGSAGYMLDVFQGNIFLGLRDGKAGAEHLLAALSVNPYLLGAWKDLGGHYYQSFRTDKAWDCWDAARRVNPQHPMLMRITEMERQLRTAFPQFF